MKTCTLKTLKLQLSKFLRRSLLIFIIKGFRYAMCPVVHMA